MANADVTITITIVGTDGQGDAFSDSETESLTSVGSFILRKSLSIDSASEGSVATIATDATRMAITDIKKIIVKNLDATNFIRIRRKDDGAHAFDEKLLAGHIAVMDNRSINVSTTAGAFSSFTSIDTIAMQADTADVRSNLYILPS